MPLHAHLRPPSRVRARSCCGRPGRAPLWILAVTTPSSRRFEPGQTGELHGYGYQTWVVSSGDGRQFAAWGLRGQNLFVAPAKKLVFVNTSAGPLGDPGSGERLSLWYGIVDSVGR